MYCTLVGLYTISYKGETVCRKIPDQDVVKPQHDDIAQEGTPALTHFLLHQQGPLQTGACVNDRRPAQSAENIYKHIIITIQLQLVIPFLAPL